MCAMVMMRRGVRERGARIRTWRWGPQKEGFPLEMSSRFTQREGLPLKTSFIIRPGEPKSNDSYRKPNPLRITNMMCGPYRERAPA